MNYKIKSSYFLCIIIFSIVTHVHSAPDIIIRGINIVNTQRNSINIKQDVYISQGRIKKIGSHLEERNISSFNGEGLFLMAGLIDSHTHLLSRPGGFFRNDSEISIEKQIQMQLKSYLASGFTTVLDAAAPPKLNDELRSKYKVKNTPNIFVLSPYLTPAGGYFSKEHSRGEAFKDLHPPVSEDTDLDSYFNNISAATVGTKVTFEEGFGPFKIWPTFSKGLISKIRKAASEKNLDIYVHSISESEHKLALSIKPYAFVHAGFPDNPPSKKILKDLKESGAFVITTQAVLKLALLMWDQEALNSNWLKEIVPKSQLETAKNEVIIKKAIEEIVLKNKPSWCPAPVARALAPFFFNKQSIQKQLKTSMKSIKMLYDNGIKLVVGSDAGNWPVWVTLFHGVGSTLELEVLEAAGIPAHAVLNMATVEAAKMLKVSETFGQVKSGMTADLIVTKDNPLKNIRTLRDIKWVIKNGELREAKDWMN